jgi:hypothetical protein
MVDWLGTLVLLVHSIRPEVVTVTVPTSVNVPLIGMAWRLTDSAPLSKAIANSLCKVSPSEEFFLGTPNRFVPTVVSVQENKLQVCEFVYK